LIKFSTHELKDVLTKGLMERALEGDLTDRLGYDRHAVKDRDDGNSRNGVTSKRVKTGSREIDIEVPRDRVKVWATGHVQTHAVYLVLALMLERSQGVAGAVGEAEGAKFWLGVLTELKNRGVEDIPITVIDGLKGFPEAIEGVVHRAQMQLCIVHMVRASLHYVA
jgi:transposase-like protein